MNTTNISTRFPLPGIGFLERISALERNKDFEVDWFVFRRIQDVSSAHRINLIRVIAVLTFFAVVAWNYFSVASPTGAQAAHFWSVARLCGAWMLLASALFTLLMLKVFPPIINYLTTSCDVLLLTAVASLGRGADSNLLVGYFLIIAASYLRFSLSLILFTSLASMFGYLILVYNTPAFRVQPDGVPFPYPDVIRVLCGLSVMAVIGWQLCSGGKSALRSSIEANLAEDER